MHTESPLDHPPSLRREAWLSRGDRGLALAVLLVCTLGGVGIGFGLGLGVRAVSTRPLPGYAYTYTTGHPGGCAMSARPWLGAVFEESGAGVRVAAVAPGSPAEAQLLPGDVIVSVNGIPAATAGATAAQVRAARRGVRLEVARDGATRVFTVTR
jgi:S1-C subfamily serine protease